MRESLTIARDVQEREREVLKDDAQGTGAHAEEEHERRMAAEAHHHLDFVPALFLDCAPVCASEASARREQQPSDKGVNE